MAIYVDDLIKWPKYIVQGKKRSKTPVWCRMISANGPEELHAFARKIGLDRNWFDEGPPMDHYALTPVRRGMAIQEGAIALDYDSMMATMRVASKLFNEESGAELTGGNGTDTE